MKEYITAFRIEEFINSDETELYVAAGCCVILIKKGQIQYIIKYKDNDMKEFVVAMTISNEIRQLIIVELIETFINCE
jgi:hypothetical protein